MVIYTNGVDVGMVSRKWCFYFSLFVWLGASCISEEQPLGVCLEFGSSVEVSRIDNSEISESSGLAVSKEYSDLLWTHNDSGGGSVVYAMDFEGGDRGAVVFTTGAAYDWEAMSLGPCDSSSCLFVGDIGDNGGNRESIVLWRLDEPQPPGAGKTMLVSSDSLTGVYPDGPRDSEAMFVDTRTGDLFLMEKSLTEQANVYRVASSKWSEVQSDLVELELVTTIDFLVDSWMGAMVTGADMAPSGHEIFARTYVAGFRIPVIRGSDGVVTGFGEPTVSDVYDSGQCESVAYSPSGLELWFTCEAENGIIAKADCNKLRSDLRD